MEIEEKDLEKLLRTLLSAMDTMDEAVELCDRESPATAMSFLGAETEKLTQNLYEVEKNNPEVRRILDSMEKNQDDEELLEDIVKGEAEIDELF